MSDATFDPPYIASPRLRQYRGYIWACYFAIPLVTGMVAHDYAPDEAFDPARHELLSSTVICRDGDCAKRPEVWIRRSDGRTFQRSDFLDHRIFEGLRALLILAPYLGFGALFAAYTNAREEPGSFNEQLHGGGLFALLAFIAFSLGAFLGLF